jgi:hypothetical protein
MVIGELVTGYLSEQASSIRMEVRASPAPLPDETALQFSSVVSSKIVEPSTLHADSMVEKN